MAEPSETTVASRTPTSESELLGAVRAVRQVGELQAELQSPRPPRARSHPDRPTRRAGRSTRPRRDASAWMRRSRAPAARPAVPRLLLEILFLVAVAVLAAVARLDTPLVVVVMAGAWALVALAEWATERSTRLGNEAAFGRYAGPGSGSCPPAAGADVRGHRGGRAHAEAAPARSGLARYAPPGGEGRRGPFHARPLEARRALPDHLHDLLPDRAPARGSSCRGASGGGRSSSRRAVFYSAWDWRFVFLLAASTVWNQLFALAIHRREEARGRKWLLLAAVAGNVALLGYFKYYDFFVTSTNNLFAQLGVDVPVETRSIVLPVGISFFTFMAISYVVDVYRRTSRRPASGSSRRTSRSSPTSSRADRAAERAPSSSTRRGPALPRYLARSSSSGPASS